MNGEVGFQNASGACGDRFLELLKFYLESTFILYEGRYYVRRDGIFIGSCVAHVLYDIFWANVIERYPTTWIQHAFAKCCVMLTISSF